ncbi:Immunity protein 50 of polymorphic toxin system [Salinibacterium sp. NYA9b]
MFQTNGSRTEMTDPERGLSWRVVGRIEQGLVSIVAITVDGVEVPYECRVEEQRGESEPWYDIEIGAFGTSPIGQLEMGLSPVYFDSAENRDPVVLLAIEAVLAWRPQGLGVRRGDGYNRCTFKGVQYRLSDFGPYFSDAPDVP